MKTETRKYPETIFRKLIFRDISESETIFLIKHLISTKFQVQQQ